MQVWAALLRATALALKPADPGTACGLRMRAHLAAAAPREARRERCFRRGSAPPGRAHREAPPGRMGVSQPWPENPLPGRDARNLQELP